MTTKQTILQSALEARNSEVMEYQINIDNYTRAIAKINTEHADNTDLTPFKEHLQNLLDSSLVEQLKAQIIRDVIAEQLAEMEAD